MADNATSRNLMQYAYLLHRGIQILVASTSSKKLAANSYFGI